MRVRSRVAAVLAVLAVLFAFITPLTIATYVNGYEISFVDPHHGLRTATTALLPPFLVGLLLGAGSLLAAIRLLRGRRTGSWPTGLLRVLGWGGRLAVPAALLQYLNVVFGLYVCTDLSTGRDADCLQVRAGIAAVAWIAGLSIILAIVVGNTKAPAPPR